MASPGDLARPVNSTVEPHHTAEFHLFPSQLTGQKTI